MFQGQCFIAVNPEVFAPGFSDRLDDLVNTCRDLDPVCILNFQRIQQSREKNCHVNLTVIHLLFCCFFVLQIYK